MTLSAEFKKYTLNFNFEAGTSRGVLKTRDIWIVKIFELNTPACFGLGEAAPLFGLSVDDIENIENYLTEICNQVSELSELNKASALKFVESISTNFPSIKMAFEMALLDLISGGQRRMGFRDPFKGSIPINGLIWMGNEDWMLKQIDQKISDGYNCLKIKIGAIDFEKECSILNSIRSKYSKSEISLRVDANGAFSIEDASEKLERLASFDLHSIEQPIKAGQISEMKLLCQNSSLPIALDEELIGVFDTCEREYLLDEINPKYIILKPSLLGGFTSTRDWINLAEKRKIGWWLTSALESNLGLAAIAEFASAFTINMPQGLGTGQLYSNNFDSPLYIRNGELNRDSQNNWDLNLLEGFD